MRVVHVQTTVQSVFGVLDDDGNVIPQEPVVGQLAKFSAEGFAEAFAAIQTRRDEIVAASNGQPEPTSNRAQRRSRAKTK